MTKSVPSYLLIAVLALGCSTSGVKSVFIPKKDSGETKPTSTRQVDEPAAEQARPKREPLIASTQHDSATRMLIETELKDLPQEERAEWISYLSSVDTKMVPYILKARRLRESPPAESPAQMAVASENQPSGHSAAPLAENSPSIKPGPSHNDSQAKGELKTVSNGPEGKSDKPWPETLKSLTDWDNNYFWPKKKPDQGHSLAIQADQVVPIDEAETVQQTRFEVDALQEPSTALENVRISPGAELWEDELSKLIVLIENSTSSQPGESPTQQVIREQIALRLMYLIVNEPALAQQPIAGMTPTQQEFWTAIFLSLAEHLDQSSTADPASRATESISQLRTAVHHLQQTARLELRNTTFCQRINSFGNYEQFDTDVFTPGQPVLIYTEIRNFASEPTSDGLYRTALRSEVQIYQGEDQGEPIDRTEFPATEDLCRTRRTDYYHSYRVTLPDSLVSGVYILKLTVQDEFSGKLASQIVQFSIR